MLTRNTIKRLVYLQDSLLPVPGTRKRVGLDALLGVLPVVGDMLSFLLSVYLLKQMFSHGVKPKHMLIMTSNLVLDTLFGTVPFIGDVFDAWFKINERNLAIAESDWHEADEKNSDTTPRPQ